MVGTFLLKLWWWVHSFWSYGCRYISSRVMVADTFLLELWWRVYFFWSFGGGYISSGVMVVGVFSIWSYMVEGIFLHKVARVF